MNHPSSFILLPSFLPSSLRLCLCGGRVGHKSRLFVSDGECPCGCAWKSFAVILTISGFPGGSRSTDDNFWCLSALPLFVYHSKISCHAELVKLCPSAWCMDYRCVECRITDTGSPEFRAYRVTYKAAVDSGTPLMVSPHLSDTTLKSVISLHHFPIFWTVNCIIELDFYIPH